MNTVESELEVLDYYRSEVDNDNYGHIKRARFEELLDNDDELEKAENRYESRRDESQHRKKVRTTLMAAFLRNGPIERATDWEFQRLFPLRTLDIDSADALIGNQTDGSILFVIILPIRKTPSTGINDAVKMLEGVKKNNTALSEDINLDFRNNRIKTAIAVEPSRDDDTARSIIDYEEEVSNPEEFYVWRISGTQGEQIDVYTDFPTGEKNHDGALGKELKDGREIIDSPHVLPDFFYDTHHSLLLEHTVTKVGSLRIDSEIPNSHFTTQEFQNYFSGILHGSDSEHKASQLSERVIDLWKYLNIIKEIDSSDDRINDGSTPYRFRTRKRRPDKILEDISEDYDERCMEFLLEVEAMEEAIESFQQDRGTQADLGTFNK